MSGSQYRMDDPTRTAPVYARARSLVFVALGEIAFDSAIGLAVVESRDGTAVIRLQLTIFGLDVERLRRLRIWKAGCYPHCSN